MVFSSTRVVAPTVVPVFCLAETGTTYLPVRLNGVECSSGKRVSTPIYACTSYSLPVITARIRSVSVPAGIRLFTRRRSMGQSLLIQRSAEAIGDAGKHAPMAHPSSRVMSQEPKCQSAQCASTAWSKDMGLSVLNHAPCGHWTLDFWKT